VFVNTDEFYVQVLTIAVAVHFFPENLLLNDSVFSPENVLRNQWCVLQSMASYNQGNMVAPQLDKKSLYFMEPKGSLPSRQEPITFSCPEPDESRSTKVLC
jgi:hypothetical protein